MEKRKMMKCPWLANRRGGKSKGGRRERKTGHRACYGDRPIS